MNNTTTWHQPLISKVDRWLLNGHRSCVLWLTGLPASGKSTLAFEVEKLLYEKQIRSYVLDGDHVRLGLNSNLGFAREDRKENVRRLAETSKMLTDAGLVAIVAAVSPYREDRNNARLMFRKEEFVEVYVKCALEVCVKRDPKEMYKKARAGEIPQFTGVSAPYEPPLCPEIVIESDKVPVSESTQVILEYLKNHGMI